MYQKVQEDLQRRADWLMAYRYEDVARCYLYPYVAFAKGERLVIDTQDRMACVLHILHQGALRERCNRLRVTVAAMDLPRAGRFRVWERRAKICHQGTVLAITHAVQYCRSTRYGLQTEMGEFDQICQPELFAGAARKIEAGTG